MIVFIIILSIFFVALAFVLNEKNAKYLLSGYNTMSEEEKQNFDLKSYLIFFKKFHIFLGSSLLIISLLIFYFINSDWSGIFMGTYPILAYAFFIWKGNSLFNSNNSKQKTIAYSAVFILLALFVFIGFEFKNSLNDNLISIHNNTLEIDGQYGTSIDLNNIESIQLVNALPEISSKVNGFALETIKKGYFKTSNGEKIKLLINSSNTPIIEIITKDHQKIFYSSKSQNNTVIFNTLNRTINQK